MLKGPTLLPRSGGQAKKLVVLFHGYGSNGEDLLEVARYWSSSMPDTEFLAPHGPSACESYPFGYQWFGLKEFTPSEVDIGLTQARPFLRDYLLDNLTKRGLTPADLVVAGFSQGGMVALDMMFALPNLGGVICYSGGFYPPSDMSVSGGYPKILLVHGDADTCVPYTFFQKAEQQLKELGACPQTLTCPGLGHTISEEGLKEGGQFLKTLFDESSVQERRAGWQK